ncbi:MAG: TIM barrel protein [Candidatus Sumerlaeota bacterium]|nr:TIM barrel protein [Candidatus Sumerlaeota bacterium]
MNESSRRRFLKQSLTAGAVALAAGPLGGVWAQAAEKSDEIKSADASGKPGSKIKWGLVTYLWGQNWDLPTLIANCEKSGTAGVELRVEHKHGVSPAMNSDQRKEVKKRFADSKVILVGMGTNEAFDAVDPAKAEKAIEKAKEYVLLSQDIGGSGVKVKPNDFHKEVEREKTIEQIGKALNVLGAFGAEHGQQIRLEVHGGCSDPAVIKQIMAVATHPNVGACWNCNGEDLKGAGLEANFDMLKARLAATTHVRELNDTSYPYQKLMNLFVKADYAGWLLLEGRKTPADPIAALIEQRELWSKMIATGQASL